MSVINQVLNQLEQRGAPAAPEQTMVRAVPHGKRRLAMPSLLALGLALGLALAAGIVTWQWIQMRKPKIVAANAVKRQPAVVAMPTQVSTVPAAAVVMAPAVVPVTAASATIAGEASLTKMLPPASRLSFELSSIPLPSTLRPYSGQAASTRSLALSAVEGSGRAASTSSGQALRDEKNGHALSSNEERPTDAAPLARAAKSQPAQVVSPDARTAAQPSSSISPMKQVSPAQHVDAEFRKAVSLMQQGHIADAIAGYEAVLRLDVGHGAARQALVALLLEGKRGADAERVLQDGLKNKQEHTGFAMLLARLQVERGAVEQATATLEKSLPYADRHADYHAFFAALLQRQNRHKEAVTHYQIALQLAPDNGVWLMGYGISLQAVQRADDARNAFRRALESRTLNAELQAFVQMKIKEL